MKPLAVALTGISKSSNTSVSYFLFWHNQSSKLSRHDRIWQVPRTLAKLHKEKTEGSHSGCSLPISLASYVFGSGCCGRQSFVQRQARRSHTAPLSYRGCQEEANKAPHPWKYRLLEVVRSYLKGLK